MRQCVILNPNAGSATEIHAQLARLGEHALFETREPGDAARFAQRAVDEGFDRVVAAGGDGTLNEVLNGLADRFDRIELGLLPLGTANDFARTAGIPAELDAAVDVLLRGKTQKVDVIKLTVCDEDRSHYFINVSTGGFATKVDEKLEKRTKLWWGSLGYALSAVKALPELEPYEVTLSFDGEAAHTLDVYNIVVANARYVGGSVPIAPEAQLDDGLVDVLIFRAVSLSRLVTLVPKALLGQHITDEDVLYRRVRHFTVASRPPFELNTDGEVVGSCPAEFEVLPRAVSFVVGTETA